MIASLWVTSPARHSRNKTAAKSHETAQKECNNHGEHKEHEGNHGGPTLVNFVSFR
jgi:hypothetical protein